MGGLVMGLGAHVPGLGADVAVAPGYPAKAGIVRKSSQSVNWSLKVLQGRPCPPLGF